MVTACGDVAGALWECCDCCYSWHPLCYAHYPLHHAHQQSLNTLTSCAPTSPQELLAKVCRALLDYVALNSYNPCCFLPFPHIPPLFPLSLAPHSLHMVFAVASCTLPVGVGDGQRVTCSSISSAVDVTTTQCAVTTPTLLQRTSC